MRYRDECMPQVVRGYRLLLDRRPTYACARTTTLEAGDAATRIAAVWQPLVMLLCGFTRRSSRNH